jgi:hypothetical protein
MTGKSCCMSVWFKFCRPKDLSSVEQPDVRLVVIAASVALLQGASGQKPESQLLTGVTMEELVPVRNMETRGEGLRQAEAEGLDAMPASVLRHPEERDCLIT